MNSAAHVALIVVMVAGVAGAVMVGVLTWAYGFTAPDLQPAAESRRRRRTRLGHALAGSSFAVAGAAAVLALTGVGSSPATSTPDVERLQARITTLLATLQNIGDATQRLEQQASRPSRTTAEAPKAPAQRPATAVPPAPAEPSPSISATTPEQLALVRDQMLRRDMVTPPPPRPAERAPAPRESSGEMPVARVEPAPARGPLADINPGRVETLISPEAPLLGGVQERDDDLLVEIERRLAAERRAEHWRLAEERH